MTQTVALVRRMPLILGANIAAAIAGIWFQVILSHRLAPSAFGTYAAILATLYAIAQVFESYAFSVAGESVRRGGLALTGASFRLAVWLGLGATAALVGFWWFADGWGELDASICGAAGLVLVTWSILWWLRGLAQGRFLESAYINNRSIELWSRLAFGTLVLALAQNISLALLGVALGAAVASIPLLLVLRRRSDLEQVPSTGQPMAGPWRAFGRMAIAYLPLALFLRLDMILAPQVFGAGDLGIYGVVSTVGKAVLVYALVLSPLIFPRIVSGEVRLESWRLVGLGCTASAALLGAAALVFRIFGVEIIGGSFGAAFLEAGTLLPYYLLALIPMTLHANVINLLLARGSLAAVIVLWGELLMYFLGLRYVAHSMAEYMLWIAGSQTIMSAAGLLMCRRCLNSTTAKSVEPTLEADVTLGDRSGRRVDRVGSCGATLQVQRNGKTGGAHHVGARVRQEVPDAVVDRKGVSI